MFRVKAEPTKNLKVLEHGREFYFKKDFESGIEHFRKYKDLANYTSSAEYYKGKMLWETKNLDEAESALKNGVSLKPDHFKCLTTLCDLYVERKKYPEAYQYFELLLKNFPVSPNHICSLIRVSIYNHKFEDIIGLIDVFSELGDADVLTKLNIAAGLAISCRYLVANNKTEKAIKVLNTAADFCMGKKEIVKEIVTQLVLMKEINEADKIFARFSQENGDSREFKLMSLEINSKVYEPDRILKQAVEMLRDGIKEPIVYLAALDASVKLGRKAESIEDLVFEAKKVNPDLSKEFEKYLIQTSA